jgi:phosphopantetheinyl transferase
VEVFVQKQRAETDAGIGGARYRKISLAGSEIHYLFLSSDMVFYQFLLKEAMERPASFLTDPELEHFRSFRIEKRKIEWLCGRLSAKLLLSKFLGSPYDFLNFDILPGADGHPAVILRLNRAMRIPFNKSLSISHREGGTAAALAAESGTSVGIDVELMESRSACMLEDYFSDREADMLEALPSDVSNYGIALGWSMKESVLKAALVGLSVPVKSVVIRRMDHATGSAEVRIKEAGASSRYMVKYMFNPPYILSIACKQ